MMALHGAQAQDRYDASSSQESSPMTAGATSSDAESLSGGKSPIQNPDASYAARAQEGGAEAERMRQAKMLEAQESFAGVPAIPTGGQPPETAAAGAGEEMRARPETAQQETTEEELEAKQAQQAADYAQAIAKAAAANQAQAEQARIGTEEQNALDLKRRQKDTKRIWDGLTMMNGMTSFTGIGYINFFILSNVRAFFGTFFPNNQYVPKPTLPQMGTTMLSNLQCCMCSPPGIFFCCATIALAAAAFGILKALSELFS